MVKRFFSEFWQTPLPQFVVDKAMLLFKPLLRKIKEGHTSDQKVLKWSFGIILIGLVLILIQSGSLNPIDLLFDIPYLSVDEFIVSISNHYSVTWGIYLAFVSTAAAGIMALIELFLTKGKVYSMKTAQGILLAVMGVVVAIAIDGCCQDIYRVLHETYMTESMMDPFTFGAMLFANFALFFFLEDALSTSLSFSMTPAICRMLGISALRLGLFHFILVACVLKVLLVLLSKIGLWEIVTGFIKKWCYTPKYICFIVVCCYGFIIFLLFPGLFKKMRNHWFKDVKKV